MKLRKMARKLGIALFVLIIAAPPITWAQEKASEQPRDAKSRPPDPRFPRRLGQGVAVDINLVASPVSQNDPCPTEFALKGRIFVNKATTVQYKFVRSDDQVMKPVTLDFDKPGAIDVTDTFRTGNSPSAEQAWALIEAISPLNVKTRSNTVFFGGSCGGNRPAAAVGGPPQQVAGRSQRVAGSTKQQTVTAEQDCISFNPGEVTVRQEGNMWKVGDGVRTLFAFDLDKVEAKNALAIIRHYKITRSCFVGRPRPSFHYMLAGDSSPQGPFKGESCRPFDPASTSVRQVKQGWTLSDGDRSLIDFGERKADADQALSIIRKYRFTHFCTMAAGKVDYVYMRK